MIIDFETRENINKFVNEYIPEGVHELYHINCREHIADIIEVLIETNVIENNISSIEAVCLVWEGFIERKLSLLN
jgi:hypothetical protein